MASAAEIESIGGHRFLPKMRALQVSEGQDDLRNSRSQLFFFGAREGRPRLGGELTAIPSTRVVCFPL